MELIKMINQMEISEIPAQFEPAYSDIEAYKISEALKSLSDLEVGNLFRANQIPPNTPIFRGTDARRFEGENKELWWTFNLQKALNYSRKKENPLVIVGSAGDLSTFEKVDYIDDSIFIASLDLYKGRYGLIPCFKEKKLGFFIMPIFDYFQIPNQKT